MTYDQAISAANNAETYALAAKEGEGVTAADLCDWIRECTYAEVQLREAFAIDVAGGCTVDASFGRCLLIIEYSLKTLEAAIIDALCS